MDAADYDGDGIGRYAMDFDPGTPSDVKRFRAPGVDGQYVIRCGKINTELKLVVRYVGPTLNDAQQAYWDDMEFMAGTACTVTSMGQEFVGCNILTSSVKRTSPIRNTGRSYLGTFTQVYFDVTFSMSQDTFA